jgi:fatty-acyl-CoA synthase
MNFSSWPPGLPHDLAVPQTSLYFNLEVAAARYPERPAIIYYDSVISYRELKRQVDALAGFLQQRCDVAKGDRVALYAQNSPQFVIAYYAILRADAVVVPINPMNLHDELKHIVKDSGSTVIVFDQALAANVTPLMTGGIVQHAIAATYSDYLTTPTDLPVPEAVSAPRAAIDGALAWSDAMAAQRLPSAHTAGAGDYAVIPYTSGTTGEPKGCTHTHASVMHTAVCAVEWVRMAKDGIALACLPMFHVTGMQNGMNSPIWLGGTMVIMTRWDKRCAAQLIARYKVTAWTAIPTMLMDFLNQPDLRGEELASLSVLSGGGAAMPKAVAERIESLWGIPYIEGYGMSETMAPTHINPPQAPKAQCLGLPICNTRAIIVDPVTLERVPLGDAGEVIVNGPQVLTGYWNNPAATAAAFVEVDGVRYLRTGDLAYEDEQGYFFMVDRVKRMINASGYKVWPAEVEALLYGHPAVQEACVIGYHDAHRGESVKALVVPRSGVQADAEHIIAWAREHMAAYKVPHAVEFVDNLPKTATGKVQWRALQEQENARAHAAAH